MQVSCIIPTRNRRDMVIMAIESALAQDECQPEIVVVNDGSTDGTERSILKRFPEVKLMSTPGLGPVLARNEGAIAAKGGVLMFLDSDDKWLPLHVKSLMQLVQKGFHVAYGVTMTRDLLFQKEFFIPERGEEASGYCFDSLTKWRPLKKVSISAHY
nr:glycosyltransferase family 2 protein [Deltaproteobacteria bacterium]